MRSSSSVNLGRIEPSLGKCVLERQVLRLWSFQMNFMKRSSKGGKGTSLKWKFQESHRSRLWDRLAKCRYGIGKDSKSS
jgi:hypothetical protein